jgi:protein ImuB
VFACVYVPGPAGSLVDFAYGFSPLVEEVDCDTVVLDIAGCELLFGKPDAVARRIAGRALEVGYSANVAVAQNPDAATHAARWLSGITVIPPGEESEFLTKLPLKGLYAKLAGVDSDRAAAILETVALWGVQDFGGLAALPEAGISERLGPDGMRLQKMARGTSNRPLAAKGLELGFEKSVVLDDPIALTEPLSFIVAGLLNQLCASLQAYALATNELRLRLKLENKTEIDRTLRLPFPTRDQKVLLRLLVLEIEADPPEAAVVEASIKAEPAKPRATQNGLFQPLAPEPEKLELTIARIAKLVGTHNVGSPEILNTHRPGAFRIRKFRVFRSPNSKSRGRFRPQSKQPSTGGSKRKPGFRVFRPPLEAEVHAPSGRPARINTRPSNSATSANNASRNINGKVVRSAGPWRTTGDWWAEDCWARDEWDVSIGTSTSEQGLYRIYRNLQTGAWFVEGMYD